MSTEAGRPRNPHVPLPPVAPPRPAAPPRTPHDSSAQPPAPARGAEPIPQDEPTRRVAPRPARRVTPGTTPPPRMPPHDPPAAKPPAAKPSAAPPPPRQRPAGPLGPPLPGRPPRPGATPFEDDVSGPPTFRLRPIRIDEPRRPPLRTLAAVVCLVLGVGLLGGTAAGTLLTDDAEAGPTPAQAAFEESRGLWHTVPVNTLFPRTVDGEGAGPGGADRRWRRVAVAPDSTCRHAFDPLLTKALSPVGCRRLVRATYADETSTGVITVGIVFTRSDRAGMRDLRKRFEEEELHERTDLMPRAYAARGTVAADFGDAQRASWTVEVFTDAPVILYAVSGFADGRSVGDPQPVADATDPDATSAPAQAGLGHAAQGLADAIGKALRARLPDPGKDTAE